MNCTLWLCRLYTRRTWSSNIIWQPGQEQDRRIYYHKYIYIFKPSTRGIGFSFPLPVGTSPEHRTFFLYLLFCSPRHIWPVNGVNDFMWFVVMHFSLPGSFSVKETEQKAKCSKFTNLSSDSDQRKWAIGVKTPEQMSYRCDSTERISYRCENTRANEL